MDARPLDLGVVGASGRLGRRLCAAAASAGLTVTLRASRREGWTVVRRPDVLIDVSQPEALATVIDYCARERVPLVEGTSGLGGEDERALEQLAARVPVVRAPNFSLASFLQRAALTRIAELLGRLGAGEETRVLERHPRSKRDLPSATAGVLARAWESARGEPVAALESLRHGPPVADHEIAWSFDGEELSLSHRVRDLDAAARGAFRAARWLAATGRAPALRHIDEVFADQRSLP